jgi:hypothetical protein
MASKGDKNDRCNRKWTFAQVPHYVMDSQAYIGASAGARSLCMELLRQYNGSNNGHLHLTLKWLRTRGMRSADMIERYRNELLERRLIVQTRWGGLSMGANYFALTFLAVTDFKGLDLPSSEYRQGVFLDYRDPEGRPTRRKPPNRGSDERSKAAPATGNGDLSHAPVIGAVASNVVCLPVPMVRNNEYIPSARALPLGRIVGKSRTKQMPKERANGSV